MTALELRNAILLLKCVDADEFAVALFDDDVLWTDHTPLAVWTIFQKDPVKYYCRCGDAHRNALFAIIQQRLTIGAAHD